MEIVTKYGRNRVIKNKIITFAQKIRNLLI